MTKKTQAENESISSKQLLTLINKIKLNARRPLIVIRPVYVVYQAPEIVNPCLVEKKTVPGEITINQNSNM